MMTEEKNIVWDKDWIRMEKEIIKYIKNQEKECDKGAERFKMQKDFKEKFSWQLIDVVLDKMLLEGRIYESYIEHYKMF
jgi:hypothetical protein